MDLFNKQGNYIKSDKQLFNKKRSVQVIPGSGITNKASRKMCKIFNSDADEFFPFKEYQRIVDFKHSNSTIFLGEDWLFVFMRKGNYQYPHYIMSCLVSKKDPQKSNPQQMLKEIYDAVIYCLAKTFTIDGDNVSKNKVSFSLYENTSLILFARLLKLGLVDIIEIGTNIKNIDFDFKNFNINNLSHIAREKNAQRKEIQKKVDAKEEISHKEARGETINFKVVVSDKFIDLYTNKILNPSNILNRR